MNNIYVFSQNDLIINNSGDNLFINKHCVAKLEEVDQSTLTLYSQNSTLQQPCILNLINTKINQDFNNIKTIKIDNDLFIEIIHTNLTMPLQVHETKCAKIYIFNTYLYVLHDGKFYCYYFSCQNENYVIEENDKIYIFNQDNLLEFNFKNKSFYLKKCQKMLKNEQIIEVLCKTPKNNTYFLLYSFDLLKNSVDIKKYQNNNMCIVDSYTLPFVFFHLCKCDFSQAQEYISEHIDFDNIKSYFSQFNNLLEIDNRLYLSSCSEICKIKFDIKDNIIYDID
ncbi:MAG: hypothetical protein IJ318_00745 [Clostridia bacterium]|nr:hypothetical protein [Clostridia bacterium]